jgi:H+/Cl- antiporter ClcA
MVAPGSPPSHGRAENRGRAWLVLALVLIGSGVASGLAGAALIGLLRLTQHLAYGYAANFPAAVAGAPAWQRVLAPTLGGLVAGVAWMVLRRKQTPSVEVAVGTSTRLPLRRSLAEAVTPIVLVGSGASIGREGAPRLAGAALASALATFARVPHRWRTVAVAGAAGAGLGTVYNAPLAGAVFALEVLGIRLLPGNLVAVLTVSAAAAATSWPILGTAPAFSYVEPDAGWPVWLWVPIAAVLGLVLGRGFVAAINLAGRLRPSATWRLPIGIAAVGCAVGVLSIWLPMLPGNGKGIVLETLTSEGSLLVFAALVVLKPLATAATYGSGADGGLIAPSLSTGASAGAAVALVGAMLGLNLPVAAFALVAGAGILAVTQRAPFFAAMFVLELAHPPLSVAAAVALCALLAGGLSWWRRPNAPDEAAIEAALR